ncbi:MAG: hypothetical protein RDU20_15085 [Desulfomonilaceae bacterium]|nr:hypothetical protein [Desulfomonilaceae bacterium]
MTEKRRASHDVVLAVASEDAHHVMEEIAGLSQLANFGFSRIDKQTTYKQCLDTADRSLEGQDLELRLVRIGSEHRVELVQLSRDGILGNEDQPEYRALWNRATLGALSKKLRGCGIDVDRSLQAMFKRSPQEALKLIGFASVQEQLTQRLLHHVVSFNERGLNVKAKFVLEWTQYRISERVIRHHRLAFAHVTPDSPFVVEAIVDMLAHLYGETLRVWHYENTATGRAIDSLLKAGLLQGLTRTECLPKKAYDEIDSFLSSLASSSSSQDAPC